MNNPLKVDLLTGRLVRETVDLVRGKLVAGVVLNWHRPGIPDTQCGRHITVTRKLKVSLTDLRAGFVPNLCWECFGEVTG